MRGTYTAYTVHCTYYIHAIIIIYIYILYTVAEVRYRLSPLIVAQGVCSWHDPWHGLEVSNLGQETLQQHLRVSFCMMFFFGFVYFELKTLPPKAHFLRRELQHGLPIEKPGGNRVFEVFKRNFPPYWSPQKSTSKHCQQQQKNRYFAETTKNPPVHHQTSPCLISKKKQRFPCFGRHVHRA